MTHRTWGLLLVATWVVGSGASSARPLQEISAMAKPTVAHLSVLDAAGRETHSGSGFVVSVGGLLATNHHVAQGGDRIVAMFSGERRVEVLGVRAVDRGADLALLQLEAGTYEALELSAREPKQGDPVTVLGSPRGLAGSLSTGIVSAVRDHGTKLQGREGGHESWGLQISAPISPGSSGSPILDDEGRVIGIAVGKGAGEALNFAIPVERLQAMLASVDAGTPLTPLSDLREGRSVSTNLMISAGGLILVALLWWLSATLVRRRSLRRAGLRRLPPRPH